MTISAVVFDLGGVLFDYQPEVRCQTFSHLSGLCEEEVERRLFHSGFSTACDRGKISARETFVQGNQLLATKMTHQAFEGAWLSAFQPNADVFALAQQLSETCALAILSNNSAFVRDGLNKKYAQYMQLFRLQIFSCEVGVVKPNPKMFATTATLLDRRPEEILIIDDNQQNTLVADTMGFNTCHFQNEDVLSHHLVKLGLSK